EGFGGGDAGGFVAVAGPAKLSAALGSRGGGGFAEVVGEHGEHEQAAAAGRGGLPLRQGGECVAAVGGVDEGIALGVPVGFLRAAVESGDFGEVGDPA